MSGIPIKMGNLDTEKASQEQCYMREGIGLSWVSEHWIWQGKHKS